MSGINRKSQHISNIINNKNDLNEKEVEKSSPKLIEQNLSSMLRDSIKQRNLSRAKELAQIITEKKEYTSSTNDSVLHTICESGNLQLIKYCVEELRLPVNCTNRDLISPLMILVGLKLSTPDRINSIKYLIEQGADVWARDNEDRTLIHHAVDSNNFEVFKILIEYSSSKGKKLDLNHKSRTSQRTALHLAAKRSKEVSVIALIQFGCEINVTNKKGYTPIHEASIGMVTCNTYATEQKNRIDQLTAKKKEIETTLNLIETGSHFQHLYLLHSISKKFNISPWTLPHMCVQKEYLEKELTETGLELDKVRETYNLHVESYQRYESILSQFVRNGGQIDDLAQTVIPHSEVLVEKQKFDEWSKSRNNQNLELNLRFKQQEINFRTQLQEYVVESEPITQSRLKILNLITNTPLSKGLPIELIQEIKKQLDLVRDPSSLITPLQKKTLLACEKNINENHSSFSQIRDRIKVIYTLYNLILSHKSVVSNQGECSELFMKLTKTLSMMKNFYYEYILQVCHAINEQQQTQQPHARKATMQELLDPVWVVMKGMKGYFLRVEAKRVLIDNAKVRDNISGNNLVKSYGGIFFKYNSRSEAVDPIDISIDCMVQALSDIVKGNVTSPTELIRLMNSEHNHIVLASQGIQGQGLDRFLKNDAKEIEKIQPASFSAQIIISLLSNPSDGKDDNYMVDQSYCLISIDNDHAFVPSVSKDSPSSNNYNLNVKNILYFFPQMEHIFDQEFVTLFLKQSPEQMIAKWFVEIRKRNEYFQSLIDQQIFTESECDFESGIKIPVHFAKGTAHNLYKKLLLIHQTLSTNPLITHRKLFEIVDPVLALGYKKISEKYVGNISLSMKEFYQNFPPEISDLVDSSEYNQIKPILEKITDRLSDFLWNRTQTLSEATTEFLESVDFETFTNEKLSSILFDISQLSYLESLTLKNEKIFGWERLHYFLSNFPNLKKLNLFSCKSMTGEQIGVSISGLKNLELTLDNHCTKVGVFGWKHLLNIFKFKKPTLASLKLIWENDEVFDLTQSPTNLLHQIFDSKYKPQELLEFCLTLKPYIETSDHQRELAIDKALKSEWTFGVNSLIEMITPEGSSILESDELRKKDVLQAIISQFSKCSLSKLESEGEVKIRFRKDSTPSKNITKGEVIVFCKKSFGHSNTLITEENDEFWVIHISSKEEFNILSEGFSIYEPNNNLEISEWIMINSNSSKVIKV